MRGILLLAIRIGVSATLLYIALSGIDFGSLQLRLSQVNAAWLVAGLAATLLQAFIAALRWRTISTSCNAPLGTGQSFKYNLIGIFFNQTLPSTIGGDAVRALLVKQTGVGWRAATYSVFVDRAIGLIFLACIIAASLRWSFQLIDDQKGQLTLIIVDLAAICAGAGFLILGRLPWPWLKTWWLTHHFHACSRIANNLLFSSRTGIPIAVLSMGVHVLTVVICWCAVRAIAAPASVDQVFLIIPPIMLITMLPISIAGWGVREATMMVAFQYAGLVQADGTLVSLLFGGASFVIGIVGGLVWILSRPNISAPKPVLPG